MDKKFFIKTIFFLLLAMVTTSESLFFQYPKEAVTDLIHSLKEKKEAAKKTHDDVHHYHLHYYPVPIKVSFDEHLKIPEKHDFDNLHREQLGSLGWNSQEYKYVPEQEIIIAEPHHYENFGDHWLRKHRSHVLDGLTLDDHLDIAAIKLKIENQSQHHQRHNDFSSHALIENVEPAHVSFHLPFHQEIIIHPPSQHREKEEKKSHHPLAAFFEKLHKIKNALFDSHDDKKSKYEDKIQNVATITSNIRATNAYAFYTFHPKSLRKF